ncbi:hypothetical protein CFOL_v3_06111, partial [Cephalotus follicularis]
SGPCCCISLQHRGRFYISLQHSRSCKKKKKGILPRLLVPDTWFKGGIFPFLLLGGGRGRREGEREQARNEKERKKTGKQGEKIKRKNGRREEKKKMAEERKKEEKERKKEKRIRGGERESNSRNGSSVAQEGAVMPQIVRRKGSSYSPILLQFLSIRQLHC